MEEFETFLAKHVPDKFDTALRQLIHVTGQYGNLPDGCLLGIGIVIIGRMIKTH